MDMYGIAATSMAMSQAQLAQGVAVSMMRKTMDTAEMEAAQLLEMLPPSDNLIDVYA